MKKVTLDTNVIISNPDLLLREDIHIIIPFTVVRELDKLKQTTLDLKPAIQKAFRIILERFQDEEDGLFEITDIPTDTITNDERIILSAKKYDSELFTEDLGARVIAIAQNVKLFNEDNEIKEYDKNYTGMVLVPVDQGIYYSNWQSGNEYQVAEVEEVLELDEEVVVNQSVVIIPDDGESEVDLLNPYEYTIFKKVYKNGIYKYIRLNKSLRMLNKAGVTRVMEFRHYEQCVAFNAVFNKDSQITVIEGEVGSGKSLIALMASIARTFGQNDNKVYDKILVTRAPIPIDKSLEIGFLPGDESAKLNPYVGGILDNLSLLFENDQKDIKEERAMQIFNENFRHAHIASIQGHSFHKTIVIFDEAQLVSENVMKQVLTRIGENSKIVILMDDKQTYGANRGFEGYKKLLPHCKGNEFIDYVKLDNIQRSDLTKMINGIF